VQITGGNFTNNKADFGGFLYKGGAGETSCTGASILGHEAVDGGAIYAVDDATVHWECDIRDTSAITGPGIYARANTTVILQGMSLVDNTGARGSVIFVISSHLQTYQVEFSDSSGSLELSAVQVNEGSSYMAEDTSFVGFEGEAVVFSEGELFLDNCDFSGSTSSVLVYSHPNSTSVIRNSVLGDKNYLDLAAASSNAGELPHANSFTNANHTCEVVLPGSGGADLSSSGSQRTPCSGGSACADGDLGVYCECYYPQRTMSSTKQERCVSRDATSLALSLRTQPGDILFPNLVEGDILLSYNSSPIQAEASLSASDDVSGSSDSSNSSGGGGIDNGVVWMVKALQTTEEMALLDWTMFPSTGLLFPGQSVTLRVVTEPSECFDGTKNVTFGAFDFRDTLVSSEGEIALKTNLSTVSFNVTFFHCAAGSFWNPGQDCDAISETSRGDCKVCTDEMEGTPEGVNCTIDGVTIRALPIRAGYWRATLSGVFIRECSNEDACKGGTTVATVDDYCSEGYQGPQCEVCSPGYGRGAANECHTCSQGFKISMYFLVVICALVTLVVVALLAVYLVGGKHAVSSTVPSTKESVLSVKCRGAGLGGKTASVGASGDAPISGNTGNSKGVPTPEVGLTCTYGREGGAGVHSRRRNNGVGGRSGEHSAATRIGATLAGLPLSKVKIFADVTNAGFPPIYDKFLSVIGIFSMDLGWILSAACLATDVTFYDKLLIVTIGPLFLLGLLGITFYLGSRPGKPRAAEQPIVKTRNRTSSAGDNNSRRSIPKGGGGGGNSFNSIIAEINPTPTQHDDNPPGAMLRKAPAARGLSPRATASGNRLWGLFARHTTMTLIILYLIYSQVSTVVRGVSR
ncbi:unnamed protein product, partial [Laminaria digitata]